MLPGHLHPMPQDALFGYYLNEATTSKNMNVDGSVTPVRFIYNSLATDRGIHIINVTLTISGGKIDDPSGFGPLASPLAVGIQSGYRHRGGYDIPVFDELKSNYDLISNSTEFKPVGFTNSTKDVLKVTFLADYGIVVPAGIAEYFWVMINDDLTSLTDMRMALRAHYE